MAYKEVYILGAIDLILRHMLVSAAPPTVVGNVHVVVNIIATTRHKMTGSTCKMIAVGSVCPVFLIVNFWKGSQASLCMTWAYHIQQCLTSALDGTIIVAVSAAAAQPLKVRASDDRDIYCRLTRLNNLSLQLTLAAAAKLLRMRSQERYTSDRQTPAGVLSLETSHFVPSPSTVDDPRLPFPSTKNDRQACTSEFFRYASSLDALPIPNNHSAPFHIQLQVAGLMAVCQWTPAAAISTVIAWFDFHWHPLCLTNAYRWSAVLFSAAATAPISHVVAADTSVSFCCC
eukprot:13286-Heterococcus_DN1.PRE.1